MLLMHVTKNNECAFCGAGVTKCKELTCQQFFHPKNSRHVFHSHKCKMRYHRDKKLSVGHSDTCNAVEMQLSLVVSTN